MRMTCVFFFKQKTAYELRISDWSSDVCSSDLHRDHHLDRSQDRRAGERAELDLENLGPGERQPDPAEPEERVRLVDHGQPGDGLVTAGQIGRAPFRERVCQYV